jgi:hypothetical protein
VPLTRSSEEPTSTRQQSADFSCGTDGRTRYRFKPDDASVRSEARGQSREENFVGPGELSAANDDLNQRQMRVERRPRQVSFWADGFRLDGGLLITVCKMISPPGHLSPCETTNSVLPKLLPEVLMSGNAIGNASMTHRSRGQRDRPRSRWRASEPIPITPRPSPKLGRIRPESGDTTGPSRFVEPALAGQRPSVAGATVCPHRPTKRPTKKERLAALASVTNDAGVWRACWLKANGPKWPRAVALPRSGKQKSDGLRRRPSPSPDRETVGNWTRCGPRRGVVLLVRKTPRKGH